MNNSRQPCYGIDVDAEGGGELVVAEDVDGSPRVTARYRADEAGLSALKRHLAAGHCHRRICVRSSGGPALDVGLQLIPSPGAEVMFVAPQALQPRGVRVSPPLVTPEQRAERLAVMARRML
jgi:hypothetical protein